MKRVMIIFSVLLFSLIAVGQEENFKDFGLRGPADKIPEGVKVGEKAPDFIAEDQNGQEIILSKVVKEKPVVLIFYRGYWCPVCDRYLKRYADSLSLLEKKGAQIIAVTPEIKENVNKTVDQTGFNISIISDQNEKIMDAYKVKYFVSDNYQQKIEKGFSADIAETNNQSDAQLPVPATYIINRNQKIVARQFDIDYTNRASVAWMLSKLEEIKKN